MHPTPREGLKVQTEQRMRYHDNVRLKKENPLQFIQVLETLFRAQPLFQNQ